MDYFTKAADSAELGLAMAKEESFDIFILDIRKNEYF